MKNSLQIIGMSLMIVGIIMAIIGYGSFANLNCYCPMQQAGQPSTCNCGEPEKTFGHILIYTGIIIAFVGIFVFIMRKK